MAAALSGFIVHPLEACVTRLGLSGNPWLWGDLIADQVQPSGNQWNGEGGSLKLRRIEVSLHEHWDKVLKASDCPKAPPPPPPNHVVAMVHQSHAHIAR